MKLLITTVFLIASLLNFNGQENIEVDDDGYLLNEDVNVSGFGGPSLSFSTVNNRFALMMGGSGGIIFNDNLFFGGYGSGITNNVSIDSSVYQGSYIGFASGGLWTGFVFMNKKKIHPVISVMVGWGSVSISNELGYVLDMDNVYVITPCLDLEMNFSDYFRLCVGIHYRKITGIEKIAFTNNDFSSLGGHITLKFGWFGANLEEEE